MVGFLGPYLAAHGPARSLGAFQLWPTPSQEMCYKKKEKKKREDVREKGGNKVFGKQSFTTATGFMEAIP